MKKIILLLLLADILFGSKILTYNIYDRHERVDVMLTFDTPYEGVLRQNQQEDTITIKLEEASIDTALNKLVSSPYLQNLAISANNDQVLITAKVNNGVMLKASKTSDSYGLRLRFSGSENPLQTRETLQETQDSSPLVTKDESEFERSYYVVIGILVIGIGILFWLKHNIATRANNLHSAPKTPWLQSLNIPKTAPQDPMITRDHEDSGIRIRFQKSLDSINSVAMLDFGTQSYLVLLGNNTIVLDKFQDNIPITQNEFETLLQTKHQELDNFFQLGHAQDEPFDAYKEKASGTH